MGIKTGSSKILTKFKNGLYNHKPKKYNIYVDGELMRYKGMIESTMSQLNPEKSIAEKSFQYMQNLIISTITFIGIKPNKIYIFLDGKRVLNKKRTQSVIKFNACLIREYFKEYCNQFQYIVNELIYGESEIQMYIQRDQTMNLNCFLTNDSDMLSICYNHKVKIFDKNNNNVIDNFNLTHTDNIEQPIIDLNLIRNIENLNSKYSTSILENYDIYDSCLWINSGRIITAIGFDNCINRLKYNTNVFHIFIALCGTDFTNNLFTETIISSILNASEIDRKYINELNNYHEIIAALLFVAIKNGCVLKRSKNITNTTDDSVSNNLNAIEKCLNIYCNYINTGVMSNEEIIEINMADINYMYLKAMKNDERFSKKSMQLWAYTTVLDDVIDNIRQNLLNRKCITKRLYENCDDNDGNKKIKLL